MPANYRQSLDTLLLDLTTGSDQQRIDARSMLRSMAEDADALHEPKLTYANTLNPYDLKPGDVVRMTIGGFGDVDGKDPPTRHYKAGDLAMIGSIDMASSPSTQGLMVTVTIAYGPGQFVNNTFDQDDPCYPFEPVDDATAALARLALHAQLYYDENITIRGDDSKSRPPDGEDFNDLLKMVKEATKCLSLSPSQ
ncbi:hypothetical protein CPT_Seuss113 [Caulobacter phage Seuss]|uniref:Uncharacterized protein n=1 Tax=Caulobacter phage Seuss TaxID=1675601 RepID=A0A0K1LME5_9CAUD|nr:hypothetical protein HOR08_gp113 [Caulobacter phage Seuss]AKU43639.1 hypothetical protein CPT_Seuss113 [Caulobacter phage Seuss]